MSKQHSLHFRWEPPGSRKNFGSHIDASLSRQPLVKGERLVRYEVNAVMHGGAPVCETPWCTEQSACSHVEWGGAKSIWQARFSKHENPNMPDNVLDHFPRKEFQHYVYKCGGPFKFAKAGSTLRSSRAVPHPSTNRALRRLPSEVGRDPVHSTRYGRR